MDSAIRRGGVFLTPLPFAKKAQEYLEHALGEHWYQSGEYRLWDMAAGTGHLELFLPKDALKYCYLSTLEQNDVQHLQKEFPSATVFQYNYLDDDVEMESRERSQAVATANADHAMGRSGRSTSLRSRLSSKMPAHLQQDLANPKMKWIILVNPPYATAQEAGLKGTSKKGVSETKIRQQMHAKHLGEVSRELYVQFLYRIMNEFKHRETLLGLFSPLKYLISSNYQRFRDNVFHATFRSGFIFSSENFGGTSKTSHFPVSFILWNIHRETDAFALVENSQRPWRAEWDAENTENAKVTQRTQRKNNLLFDTARYATQKITLDILDNAAQKIGTKIVESAHRDDFLSRWIKRPRSTSIFPPLSSALTVKSGNVDTRHRIAEGFLASLMCPGNELQNQQQTAFLSGPQASAGALSVTPENFEQAVIVFAARRIPHDSWVNHVDQLLRPNRELSPQFVADCAVWSLFDSKNQTVALQDVKYQERVYQIVNHFFPFPVAEVRGWLVNDERMKSSLGDANNSFVADWLLSQRHRDTEDFLLCASVPPCETKTIRNAMLTKAREIYQFYFAHLHRLPLAEFGIETYDAGWHQIRKALQKANMGTDLLADLKQRHDLLKESILPQLVDYGIVNVASSIPP